MNFWDKISNYGIDEGLKYSERKRIALTNQAAMLLMIPGMIIAAALTWSGTFLISLILFVSLLPLIFVPFLNKKGYVKITGFAISVLIPISIVIISTLMKIYTDSGKEFVMYFGPRIFMIAMLIIPIIIINYRDKIYFFSAILVYFIGIACYDIIQNMAGVGIEHAIFVTDRYILATVTSIFSFFIIVVGFISLQAVNIRYEKSLRKKNIGIITAYEKVHKTRGKLKKRNKELQLLNTTIEKQKKIVEESEGKYKILFEKSDDAILLIDKNIFIDCNQSAVTLFGYKKKSELISIHPSGLSPAKQDDGTNSFNKAEMMIQEACRLGTRRFDWMHIRKNNEKFPAEVWLTAIPYGNEHIVHAVVRDLTYTKLKERKIQEQYEDLVAIEEELRQNNEEQRILKENLEKNHKEITDSIAYAKTIQDGLLTKKEFIDLYLKDYFLLFKSKNQVGGDFYYINKINKYLIFTVADCTGHGVHGGFLTMLGITYLHDIVRQDDVHNSAQVLNIMRSRFKETFRGFGTKSHIGLDIALCVVDTETNQLQYAGAFNPLWIIRQGKLVEYKPKRNPIGFYPIEEPFDNNVIQLEKNDLLYIFSDGFRDQIGGERNRKYTTQRFKETFMSIHTLSMSEQKATLLKIYYDWVGNSEQLDDITILGVKW